MIWVAGQSGSMARRAIRAPRVVVTFDPRITPPADVALRSMLEELRRGPIYRLVRLVKNGPICPSVIMWVQTRFEPGEPDNAMERSPHVGAYLSGQPENPVKLYMHGRAGTRHCTRAEYEKALAEVAASVRQNLYDPRCQPWKPVKISALSLPFARA